MGSASRFSPIARATPLRSFDVMPDGRVIAVIGATQAGSGRGAPHVQVVLNWTEELKQRVPLK